MARDRAEFRYASHVNKLEPRAAHILAFLLIQPGTMFVCLRMLQWGFFVSAILATALALAGMALAGRAFRRERGSKSELGDTIT